MSVCRLCDGHGAICDECKFNPATDRTACEKCRADLCEFCCSFHVCKREEVRQ